MGQQFTFQDIFKKSFLDLGPAADVSLPSLLLSMIITLLIALFIFQIYKATFKGVVYSHSFNISLVLLTLVTAMVIMTISSNVVLSLGMVGALSIVRFRAAIKDPRDIIFMFWAIGSGIASGAGMHLLALAGCLFIGGVLYVMSRTHYAIDMYLLIVKYENKNAPDIFKVVSKLNYHVRSKVVTKGYTELTIELKNPGENTVFVDEISGMRGVQSAMLVKYNGDYAE